MQWFADISMLIRFKGDHGSSVPQPCRWKSVTATTLVHMAGVRYLLEVAHEDTQCMTASAIPLLSNQSEGGFFYPLANAWDRFASEEPVNLHRSSAGYNRGDQFVGE